jgi:uracil-DNA glycosylase
VERALDPTSRDALEARLRFYRDLGLREFYRRPVDPALLEQLDTASPAGGASVATENEEEIGADEQAAVSQSSQTQSQNTQTQSSREDQDIPPRKPISAPPQVDPAVASADRETALRMIREDLGDCTRCALHKGRNKIVFSDGSAHARLFFVGEGPGADEDAQGLPFVGRAGQLLNNMIGAMGLKREEVYIANVVKCRPPSNRTPEPEEANICSPFLFRQIDVVRPEVIVALGATAATYLLGQRQPLAGLRGRVHPFRGSKLIVTYHPAFLLRDPRQKKEAWADLQIAMRELGLKPPQRD